MAVWIWEVFYCCLDFNLKVFICSTHSPYWGGGYTGGEYGGIPLSGIVHSYIVPTMATEPDNNALNIQPRSYINDAGKIVLQYLSPDTIILNLHFILTQGKRLTKNMPYMKLANKNIGEEIAAIRLLGFQDYEGMIYLNVQDIKTNRCYNLTWNMEIDDDWWFWSLADFETLTT